jgi:hypothetical protein
LDDGRPGRSGRFLTGEKIRQHIRSNVVGYVALFIALSGTAYAAGTVGSDDVIDNSLISADIRNDTSTSPSGGLVAADLRPGSVGTSEVANDNLTGGDIAPNSLKGADVNESTLGFPGAIQAFAGDVGIQPLDNEYVFLGPTVNVTTTAAQPRITGAASAPLRKVTAGEGIQEVDIGLCHKATTSPLIENFVGEDAGETPKLDDVARIQAATASVTLAPGTYKVGFCMRNIDQLGRDEVGGGRVNGWVMRTG